MAGLNCEIKWETRLCEVNGELGYFHCWEHCWQFQQEVLLLNYGAAEELY